MFLRDRPPLPLRHPTLLLLAFAITASIGAFAGEPARPQISAAFPPAEDIRAPDLAISTGQPGAIDVLAYSPDGRILAAAGPNLVIQIRDSRTGEQLTGDLIQSLRGHTAQIRAVAFGADGKSLASVSGDRTVRTWDVASGKQLSCVSLGTLVPDSAPLGPVALLAGREPLLVACAANQLVLWNITAGKIALRLEPNDTAVACLALGADGKSIAAATIEGVVRVWNSETGTLLLTENLGAAPKTIAVSSTHLAAIGPDGTPRLWSVSGEAVALAPGRRALAEACAFSTKGDQLACATAQHTIDVWDVATGTLLCSQAGSSAEIDSIAFNSNGQKMVSGAADGSIQYWTDPLPPIPPAVLAKIQAALPAKAGAIPKRPRKLLVFWRADAILHKDGVPAANHAIELMGRKTGAYTAYFSRDYGILDPTVLSQFDAIVLNSTAHLAIPKESMKQALLDYVRNGGGVVGIHAAIDTFSRWPEGARIVGATFGDHPWHPTGTWAVKLEAPSDPILRAWNGKDFRIHDEFYEMGDPYSRSDRRVLLTADMSDPATAAAHPHHRKDGDFALSWIKHYGRGRVFYSVFGHLADPFENPAVLEYDLDGIQYALGDFDADDTPLPARRPGAAPVKTADSNR